MDAVFLQACKDIIQSVIDAVLYIVVAFSQQPYLFVVLCFSVFNAIMGFVFGLLGLDEYDAG